MLLGAKLSANHINPEGQMSLFGLPIPVPRLYAKNNLNDGLRHRSASTVTGSLAGQSKALRRWMGGWGHGSFFSYEIPFYLEA